MAHSVVLRPSWRVVVICTLALAAASFAVANPPAKGKPVKEAPLGDADVFVDQPDNLATRVKVQTDRKGEFKVSGLKPGMYRVVVQLPGPARKPDEPKTNGASAATGPLGLRYATRWGDKRPENGDINYVTLYLYPSAGSGATSMNQKLINGRTMGVFTTVYKAGEVVTGRVEGSP